MVSALYIVRHDSKGPSDCALCGAKNVPLFTLNLTAREEPRLEPLAPKTHTGICENCWWRIGTLLRRKTSYRAACEA